MLLRNREDRYAKEIPNAADILLIIEVSDTTLVYDCLEKLPRYALAGIPEVWITDVNGEAIERYTQPVRDQADFPARTEHQRAGAAFDQCER